MQQSTISIPRIILDESDHFITHGSETETPEIGVQPAKIRIDGLSTPADVTALSQILSEIQHFYTYGDAKNHDIIEDKITSGLPVPENRLPFSYYSSVTGDSVTFMIIPNTAERPQRRKRTTTTPPRTKSKSHLTYEKRFERCGYQVMQHDEAKAAYRELYRLCVQSLQDHVTKTHGDTATQVL